MKRILLYILSCILIFESSAQILSIRMKNGAALNFPTSQIDYIELLAQEDNNPAGTIPDYTTDGHSTEPRFNELVELMGLLWRLGGSPEYSQCNVASVAQSADVYFSGMRTHEAVRLATQYSRQNIVYDAVTGFANQLIFNKDWEIIFDPDYQDHSNSSFDRFSKSQKQQMLTAINDFYKQSGFHDWFLTTLPQQEKAIASFKDVCNVDYDWFDSFYEPSDKITSRIFLSFMLGPSNNGISLKRADGTLLLTPTLGSLNESKSGEVTFNGDMGLIIHEFSHPYCNPLIEKRWSMMSDKAEAIYSTVAGQMQSQAYSNAQSMMCETLVRASTISYLKTHNLNGQALQALAYEKANGFMLVPSIVEALDQYVQQSTYATLADFMPTIIDVINSYEIGGNTGEGGNGGNTSGETTAGYTRETPIMAEWPTDHDYVDLGIDTGDGHKLYFATMNVGETTIGGSLSNVYRWGATRNNGEGWYSPDGLDWPKGHMLDDAHDIATIEWGAGWHIPSVKEWNMLIEQCDCERKEAYECQYGVAGYFFYKKNDHNTFIFLPVADWSDGPEYWSSEIHGPYQGTLNACTFNEAGDRVGTYGTAGIGSMGFCVRPVFVK